MDIKRHVIIQAIKTKENELIPIWDERLVFEKTEMYGNTISLKGEYGHYYNLVECIYDLKTKKIEVGIELDYYPKNLEFKKDEIVLFELSHRNLVEAKIVEIVFEEYEIEIKRGRKLDNYWLTIFKGVEIDENALYAIKQWKPYYVLDNGITIKWEHQLYHKQNKIS